MHSMLMIVPLLVLLTLTSCAVKLSAMFLRYRVQWKHALMFSVFSAVLSLAARGVATRLGPVVGPVLGFALLLAIGSWFFGERGRKPTGEAIGFARGAALVGVAQLMLLGVGIALIWFWQSLRQ